LGVPVGARVDGGTGEGVLGAMSYPRWKFYPSNLVPPPWARDFVAVLSGARASIDTADEQRRNISDAVLAALRPGLEALGYVVERGKAKGERIHRPVLFGEDGETRVTYEVDAWSEKLGVVVEVEAGRGAMNNADLRDIIRASLIVDARYLALVMPVTYRFDNGGKTQKVGAYEATRDQLDAIYQSQRLRLPFEGLLLVGY
jgi:hypothetical protein